MSPLAIWVYCAIISVTIAFNAEMHRRLKERKVAHELFSTALFVLGMGTLVAILAASFE